MHLQNKEFICLKPIDCGGYKEYNYDRKNKSGQNVWGLSLGVYRTEK